MTSVNIDPHVILHQKTHVPRVVNFFESQKAFQHPVSRKNLDPLFSSFEHFHQKVKISPSL